MSWRKRKHHRTWAMVCSLPSCWTPVKGSHLPRGSVSPAFPLTPSSLLLKPNSGIVKRAPSSTCLSAEPCHCTVREEGRQYFSSCPHPAHSEGGGGTTWGSSWEEQRLSTQRKVGTFSPESTEKQHQRLYETEETDTAKIVQTIH